jgi:hypothetical protein
MARSTTSAACRYFGMTPATTATTILHLPPSTLLICYNRGCRRLYTNDKERLYGIPTRPPATTTPVFSHQLPGRHTPRRLSCRSDPRFHPRLQALPLLDEPSAVLLGADDYEVVKVYPLGLTCGEVALLFAKDFLPTIAGRYRSAGWIAPQTSTRRGHVRWPAMSGQTIILLRSTSPIKSVSCAFSCIPTKPTGLSVRSAVVQRNRNSLVLRY